ncbi:hypothetical protein EXE59_09875 [Nocardioides eburneiflavus]|uniref:DUF2510 domain-containing protein n=1 Tax=Nocardioides eburneiflavus TaxID=2518372 RepID=A0A4Z1CG85_9ACTN|nr:hypothetical protein [Nocardioides eburneiflavus]TGN64227.1 hypothetical protein EXE59_09875 [Nocardioides eburneiflavus]
MSDTSSPGTSDESAGSPPPPPLVSPDGKFWWDGSQWQPFATEAASSTAQYPSPAGSSSTAQANPADTRVMPPPVHVASTEAATSNGSGFKWSWLFRIAIPLAVLGWWLWPQISGYLSEAGVDVASGSLEDVTCDELADDAVRISEEDTGLGTKLLKVREPRVVEDNRATYEAPTGTNEEVVLACRGQGSWEDGSDVDVRVELTVDSDGDAWVFYKPMP